MVDIVQCYDPAKDKWENRFELPEALGGIRACTLVLKHPSDYTVVNVEKEISMLEIGSNHRYENGKFSTLQANFSALDTASLLECPIIRH